MYKGKEICQGCGRTGSEHPRWNKDEMCHECNEVFKKGKAISFEESIEYTNVRDWHNGFSKIDMDDRTLDVFANEVLEALNNPTAKPTNTLETARSQYLGSRHYIVPTGFATPFNNLLNALNNNIRSLKKEKEEISVMAKNAVKDEKNKIFNEGVEEGRNLLMQLNRGDITMDDFSKNIVKY